jgi:hypothetical protein
MSNDHGIATPAPIWGSEIPVRNPYFTGRTAVLETLRSRLGQGNLQVLQQAPMAVFGLGGIGKTEIATEYAHRHAADYQIVWWIRAETAELVGDAFVRLARRLGVPMGDRDKMIWGVQGKLTTIFDRWLLIFDNADSPDAVNDILPGQRPPGGHVIVTSRDQHWRRIQAEGIEVSEFAAEETIEFLRKRVADLEHTDDPDLDAARHADAKSLGDVLGHLPLVAEHAAAYLNETDVGVAQYIEEFASDAYGMASRPADIAYAYTAIDRTWNVSARKLSPDAREVFQLSAFFSPEPIAEELFFSGAQFVKGPAELHDALSDRRRCQAAFYELHRFSLIKYHGGRAEIRVHRVVQAVTRGRVVIDEAKKVPQYRAAVHALLAATDPRAPDRSSSDNLYDKTLPHLVPADAINTDNPLLRGLITNQVRRLHLRGRHSESLWLGEKALAAWTESLGESDPAVLRLAAEIGIVLRLASRSDEAFTRNEKTLALCDELIRQQGPDHEEAYEIWLICANSHGADLRLRAEFQKALDLDLDLLPRFERLFLPFNERTLNVRNNIGADYRRLGHFQEALEYDQETLSERSRLLGAADPRTLASKDSMARDLRGAGNYRTSLEEARSVVEVLDQDQRAESPDSLNARKGFAVALRKAGFPEEALVVSRRVYETYAEYLGEDHRYTLSAAANLIVDLRLNHELAKAEELGALTLAKCMVEDQPPGSITFAVQVNLAAVRRKLFGPVDARELDEQALEGLTRIYGPEHPFTLVVATNLASDLYDAGRATEARDLGEKALAAGRRVRTADHPDTLATAANLSIDLRATGNVEAAQELLQNTLARYAVVLSPQHPEARAAEREQRISLDLEPY